MSDEIGRRYAALDVLADKVSKKLKEIKTKKDATEDHEQLKLWMNQWFQDLEIIKVELRDVDEDKKKEYKKKFKEQRTKYQELLAEVKEAKQRSNTEALMNDAETKGVGDDGETEEAYIKEGEELLDSNQQALRSALQTAGKARELGTDTVGKLKQQNEKMERIGNDLDQMDDMLKVSQKVIGSMARRMKTDKYLWVIIGLGAMAILAVIIVSQVKKD